MSKRGIPQQSHRLPGAWTLIRDILSFLGGWVLIFLEVQRPEVRPLVLLLAGGTVGIPGLGVGVKSIAELISQRPAGTPDLPLQQAEPRA